MTKMEELKRQFDELSDAEKQMILKPFHKDPPQSWPLILFILALVLFALLGTFS